MAEHGATGNLDWDELARFYAAAAELAGVEREDYLGAVCLDRPQLRSELDAMLAESPADRALELESRVVAAPSPAAPSGTRIGAYRILRRLAQGGMGEVYLAERVEGSYQQRVAIKLLRPGLESVEVVERFRLERDLLARLTHPAIVPLLDGGTTPAGRPYLVLQYVEGLPITEHCVERQLAPRDRARLFATLCRAVQYAHSNLIVHRDLKPSNILVTPEGDIRLLDFGIAKLLAGDRPAIETTRAAAAPMTPGRAAPEQRRGEPPTTATDVWALGILLHELLTGSLPARAGSDAVTDSQVESAAAKPVPVGGAIDRDLAAIVSMAMRIEPLRRYASAGQLGEEIDRWLAGEPVLARPDSWSYRVQRFVGRHKAAVAGAVASILALAALAIVSTLQSWQVREERNRATAEAEKAGAVVGLLTELFGATDPTEGAAAEVIRIDDLLDRGEARARDLEDRPDLQAELRHALGRILLARGSYPRARALLTEARDALAATFGENDPRVLPARLDYARVLHSTGDTEGARLELRGVVAAIEGDPRRDPAVEARALQELGSMLHDAEGERLIERAIVLWRSHPHPDPVTTGSALVSLGMFRWQRGDEISARTHFAEALALERPVLGAEHPHVLSLRSNLANLLAEPAARATEHRSILEARSRRLGERHPQVANSWNYLGLALAELEVLDEAATAFERAHEIWVESAGPTNGQALRALRNRAWIAGRRGELAAARRHYDQLLELLESSRLDPKTIAAYRSESAELSERLPTSAAPATPRR